MAGCQTSRASLECGRRTDRSNRPQTAPFRAGETRAPPPRPPPISSLGKSAHGHLLHCPPMPPTHRNCAGVSRRDFLKIGLGGTLGMGFCDLLRLRAAGTPESAVAAKKNVNCIMIWMD